MGSGTMALGFHPEVPTMRQPIRIALVVLGLNCICFFHGCEKQNLQMTFGFPAPVVTVQYDDAAVQTPAGTVIDVTVPTNIVSWTAWSPVVNGLFLLVLAAWIWQRGGIAPTPWRCFWLSATILNTLLVPIVGVSAWIYLVWLPTAWVAKGMEFILVAISGSEWSSNDWEQEPIPDIASRLYFVILFAACWGLAVLGGSVYRRFTRAPVMALEPDAVQTG
jgi:hypothetical protein